MSDQASEATKYKLKSKLTRQMIQKYRLYRMKGIRDPYYDPNILKNLIELQQYQEHDDLVSATRRDDVDYWIAHESTQITRVYSHFKSQLDLTNSMIKETKRNWVSYLKTKNKWMANIVMGLDDLPVRYMKLRHLGLQLLEQEVFKAQQYRSQALHDNVKTELVHSSYVDEQK